jgi:signal transduction histidine kinase/HAMP domain-containing protein
MIQQTRYKCHNSTTLLISRARQSEKGVRLMNISSLRSQLIWMMLIVFVPLAGLTLANIYDQHRNNRRAIQHEVLHTAQQVAAEHERYLEASRQLLMALAQLPAVRNHDAAACNELFSSLKQQSPLFIAFGALDHNGDYFCLSNPIPPGLNAAHFDWFQQAVSTHSFAMGEYAIARVSQQAAIPISYPVVDEHGQVTTVLLAGLSLEWLDAQIEHQALPGKVTPADVVIMVVDRNGTILARQPGQEASVEQPLPDLALMDTIQTQQIGVTETIDHDGRRMIAGFAPLSGEIEGAYVITTIPEDAALAADNALLRRSLLVLTVVAFMALMVAWVSSDQLIMKPVNRLVAATQKLAMGEMQTRTGIPHSRNELSYVSSAIDQMAEALQQREAEAALAAARQHRAEQDRQQAIISLEEVNRDLQRNRDLLDTIINGIDDGLLLLDNSGCVLAANYAMISLLGRTSADLILHSWTTICAQTGQDSEHTPSGQPFPGMWVLDVCTSGTPQQRRERFLHADGTIRMLDMYAAPIRYTQSNGTQAVEHVVLHTVDVTEKLKVEAMLIEHERLLTSRRLTAIVAHEVNTPLQHVLTLLERIPAESSKKRGTSLELAQEEIVRIGEILQQIQEIYHLPDDHVDSVHINRLIERVLLLTSSRLIKLHIRTQRHLSTNLPPLYGRSNALIQVLLNLVINAIQAMPEGGTLSLSTSFERATESHAARIRIDIADTGSGIEPDMQPRIFDAFFTTRGDGSGLGLFVSQQIIHDHGGTLSVASQPGRGTTFTIHIPLNKGT